MKVEFEGRAYVLDGDDWYDAETYLRPPAVIIRQLENLLQKPGASGEQPKRSKGKIMTTKERDDDATFRHAEVFPIIAEIIRDHSRRAGGYITHREIAGELLLQKEGRALAEEAAEKQGNPAENVASNMVAWFSKRFTEGETLFQGEFERKKIRGRWAYKAL